MATARCTILMYHVIDRPRAPAEAMLCCPPTRFREQLVTLGRSGHVFVSLSRLLEHMRGRADLPDRSVVVTIDDGLACSFEHALPVLTELGVPATLFMVAGLVGGDSAWLKDTPLPMRRMLSLEELRGLAAANVEIGSHTMTHASLDRCTPGELRAELAGSKALLEDALGRPVLHFAYPYGRHDARIRDAVEAAGYATACTCLAGKNASSTDCFMLRRVEVLGSDALWQFRGKVRLGTRDMPPLSLGKQAVKRALAHARWVIR